MLSEGILFDLSSSKPIKNRNSHFSNIVKLHSKEKICEVQRQHIVALLIPASLIIVGGIILILLPLILNTQKIIPFSSLIIVYFFLFVGSLVPVLLTFVFMFWYYQFYIITTRCIMHRHFFRLGGYYSEEVFLETSPEREIIREASNYLFGLLDIEDVIVYFQRPGLENFTFKMPENPQKIEDSLEQVCLDT